MYYLLWIILLSKLFIPEFLSSVRIFDFIGFLKLYTSKFNCICSKCGEDKPDDIVMTTELLMVGFRTDGSGEAKGFKAQYTLDGMPILSLRNRLIVLV